MASMCTIFDAEMKVLAITSAEQEWSVIDWVESEIWEKRKCSKVRNGKIVLKKYKLMREKSKYIRNSNCS